MHLHTQQEQFSIIEFPQLSHPAILRTGSNILSSKQFWINKRLNAHCLERLSILRQHILVVIHTSHRLLCSELLSQHSASDIVTLVRSNGNDQVSILDASILQSLDRHRRLVDSHNVKFAVEISKLLAILIHENNVHIIP